MFYQANNLIFTAADYKITLAVSGKTFPLLTVETIGQNITREEETIYAVGQEEPIGQKRNAAKYGGKLTIQAGELNAILQILGLVEATQITGAALSIIALVGNYSRTYGQVNINTEALDVKAKDKQTPVNTDWTALTVGN